MLFFLNYHKLINLNKLYEFIATIIIIGVQFVQSLADGVSLLALESFWHDLSSLW